TLSPEAAAFYQKYGRLPPTKKDLLGKQIKSDRKYFDSGDYALSQAGRSSPKEVGSLHPSPDRIPHSVPAAAKKEAGGAAAVAANLPAKESALAQEVYTVDAAGAATAPATPTPTPAAAE
ncbi:hypothetical protein HK405_001505, partial [Cladochytrium tenue]